MSRTFEQYFTFWFLHFVNCGEPSYVVLDDKENYLKTMRIAKSKEKPIPETMQTVRDALKEFNL